jgi:hypothetical protein
MGSFRFFAMDCFWKSYPTYHGANSTVSSEELCNKAAEAIRREINAPAASQRVQTLGRVVCFARKDK